MDELTSTFAADDLKATLSPLVFTGLVADQVTATLTAAVTSWGLQHGWMPAREVPSHARRGTHNGQRGHHGFLDVVFDRWGLPPVVVEIDRGNKQWSLDKLTAERDEGSVAIWVRWGRRPPTVPEGIGLVHLPVTMQRGSPRRYSLGR